MGSKRGAYGCAEARLDLADSTFKFFSIKSVLVGDVRVRHPDVVRGRISLRYQGTRLQLEQLEWDNSSLLPSGAEREREHECQKWGHSAAPRD